jgi:CubicO group peptidase (beta-lactamase class C family)
MVQGIVHPRFAPLRSALEKQIRNYPGGAAIAAYADGELVADLWGGVRNTAGDPWEQDTLSVSFSTTKGVASTAIHILADRGLIDYEAPVARYWPEFAQQGKGTIKVRHLLCHEAGLYDVRSLIRDIHELLDWDHMINLLAAAKPAHAPGVLNAYHGITYGYLTGELVRRISGKPFPRFVAEEIARPLGLDGFYVGTPASELHRVAQLLRPARGERPLGSGRRKSASARLMFAGTQKALGMIGLPHGLHGARAALLPRGIGRLDFSSPEVVQACIPAANGVFTARSLARMYACLANGGELDGVRLLSRSTIEHAAKIQNRRLDHVLIVPLRWRLGYHMVGTSRGISRHAFGHFGYGGSGAWAHPRRNLSFAMTVNSGQGTPMGDLRMVSMSGLMLGCAKRAAKSAGMARAG